MPRYLDPKNDLTFKRVFGEHKHLCISLINSMLPTIGFEILLEYIEHLYLMLLEQDLK